MNKEIKYEIINRFLLNEVIESARNSSRLRKNYNFHELEDRVQRMLNALEPDSYVRPHRHLTPPKPETFVVLKGKFGVMLFDDDGTVTDAFELGTDGKMGVDIKPKVWHTVFSLESGSVFFEVKPGPYDPATDKDFAEWAPDEEHEDGFLNRLKEQFYAFIRSNETPETFYKR